MVKARNKFKLLNSNSPDFEMIVFNSLFAEQIVLAISSIIVIVIESKRVQLSNSSKQQDIAFMH